MAVNLAEAYVDIVPSTGNLAKLVMGKVDPIFEEAGKRAGGSMVSNIGSSLVSGLTGYGDRVVDFVSGWFSRAAKLGAVVWGATFGSSLVAGFNRLRAIDDAEAKLRGLGHSAESVEIIMNSALDSVRGTAFGLGDAATIAASAVAAGIKPGEELTRTLSLTGDAAAIAGISLGEMGSIFNKIAANQKLTTMELNQLQDRGIPVLQWLQEEYGITADKAREMVTKGQVDFETFQRLIETNIGGAALAMGDSFSGAFANMRAAFGRFGAAILKPFFDAAAGGFATVTGWVDRLTAKVTPLAELWGGEIVGAFYAFANAWKWADGDITSSGLPGFAERLAHVLRDLTGAWSFFTLALREGWAFTDAGSPINAWMGDLFLRASQLGKWVHDNRDTIASLGKSFLTAAGGITALATGMSLATRAVTLFSAATPAGLILGLATALVYAWQNSETFREVVTGVFEQLLTVVGPMIELFRSMLSSLFGGDGDGSWADIAAAAWAKVQEVFIDVLDWFSEHVKPTLQSFFDAVVAIVTFAVAVVTEIWNRWGDRIMEVVGIVATHVKNVLEGALTIIRGIFEVFAGLFSGDWSRLWEGIKTILSGAWTIIRSYLSYVTSLIAVLLRIVWDSIKEAAAAGWNAIKDAIVSALEAAKSKVREIVDWIKNKIDELTAPFRWVGNKINELDSMIPGFGGKIDWTGMFAAASGQKMHTGGYVPDTPSGEFLTVLQSGEYVMSREAVSAMRGNVDRTSSPPYGGRTAPVMQVEHQHFHDRLDVSTVARTLDLEFAAAVF